MEAGRLSIRAELAEGGGRPEREGRRSSAWPGWPKIRTFFCWAEREKGEVSGGKFSAAPEMNHGSLRRRLSSLRGAWRWSTGHLFRKVGCRRSAARLGLLRFETPPSSGSVSDVYFVGLVVKLASRWFSSGPTSSASPGFTRGVCPSAGPGRPGGGFNRHSFRI